MGEIADAIRHAEREAPKTKLPESPSPSVVESTHIDHQVPAQRPPDLEAAGQDRTGIHGIVEPHELTSRVAARATLDDPHEIASQEYLRVAFRLRDLAIQRRVRSIVVTSSEPGEGKTTTACNLATQFARLDRSSRIALVDLDLHRASLAAALGIQVDVGFDSVIRDGVPLSRALMETDLPGLWVLGLRHPAVDAESLVAHPNLSSLIAELERDFDLVVIDSPPILSASDAQIILRRAGAGLLVARAGKTQAQSLRRALEHIPRDKFLGTLLNFSRRNAGLTGYAYYAGHSGQVAPSDLEIPDGQ